MLYRGRVYYINMTKFGIYSPVYSLHFTNYYEKKTSKYGFRYYRKSLHKKTVIPNTIPSLNFKTFKNKGYKLAGFYDENIRKKCIKEIRDFLIEYVNIDEEIKYIKKINPRQKKLFIIVAIYGQQYGLHLIYNVLSYLKVVSKEDFHYMSVTNQYINKKS